MFYFQMIVTGEGFSVSRRVVVDLTKARSKRTSKDGKDPNSIHLYSGA